MEEEKIKRVIETILSTIRDTDVEEVEVESEGFRVKLKKFRREKKRTLFQQEETLKKELTSEEGEEGLYIVRSPFVGIFYRSPSPDAPPFVEVGERVEKGQTLCIIEAMKIMNEVESDVTGKVIKIYVENGSPVEYNHPLFAIEVEE